MESLLNQKFKLKFSYSFSKKHFESGPLQSINLFASSIKELSIGFFEWRALELVQSCDNGVAFYTHQKSVGD